MCMSRPVRQTAALVKRRTTLFARDRQLAARRGGAKFAVFDCILLGVLISRMQSAVEQLHYLQPSYAAVDHPPAWTTHL